MSVILLIVVMCSTYGWSRFTTFLEPVGFCVIVVAAVMWDLCAASSILDWLGVRPSEPKATGSQG